MHRGGALAPEKGGGSNRSGRRRTADQVIERAERGGCPGAHGDDDLLVGHGGAVAGSEDAG